MAIDDMNLIENKDESLPTASFTVFKDALKAAALRPSPTVNIEQDASIDQMLTRWKNSTKKSISESDWDEIRELCRRVYYEREENKTTISRGIWQVLKDNIL